MDIIDTILEVWRLKETDRTGFVVECVDHPESVGDHSFGAAFLAFVLSTGRKDIDRSKVVYMALIHDLAESEVGDILVDWKVAVKKREGKQVDGKHHGVTEEEKYVLEQQAMQRLAARLPNGEEILALWEENEKKETPEACFVRSIDKLDMFLQALWYERSQGKDFTSWFDDKRNEIGDDGVRTVYEAILLRRKTNK